MVDDIKNSFNNLQLSELYQCENALKSIIKCRKNEHRLHTFSLDINNFIDQHDNFASDMNVDADVLHTELASLKSELKHSTALGVQNTFLSTTDRPYTWQSKSGPVVNPPINIAKYHEINSMLLKLNAQFNLDLNSCLFSYYGDGDSCTRLHNDNEHEMDPNQPICVVTFGAPRKVDFLNVYQVHTERPLLTIEPEEGSLYIMTNGCQEFFKHRVKRNSKIREERYSLSFRRIIPLEEEQSAPTISSPVKDIVLKWENLGTNSTSLEREHLGGLANLSLHTSPPKPPVPKPTEKTAVIFGTSMTLKVDGNRLGKKGRNVINCSKSGAKIQDIGEMVENFYFNHGDKVDVDKIIFSFGTNDIRFETKNIYNKFYRDIVELIEKTKCLFPKSTIFVQTVLPMRIVNTLTAQNVLEFNRLLVDICIKLGCPIIDCFRDYVSPDGYDYNRRFYRDDLHLNSRGIGVLCRWFKYVLYETVFNPFIMS